MTDKAEIRTGQINGDDRTLKGLQNGGLVNFKCADCNRELLVLQLTTINGDNSPEILTRVAVQCGSCGGCSYIQQIHGQFYPGAPNDQVAFDVSDDDMGAPEVDVLFKAWEK